MGLPFPPTWEEGRNCLTCSAPLFSDRTPVFIYAFAQDIAKCPGAPAEAPDPNHVVRMTQHPVQNCFWSGVWSDGPWQYNYAYYFTLGKSNMFIADISGMTIFKNVINFNCRDSFLNEWVCGAPDFPAFSGGRVNCFW